MPDFFTQIGILFQRVLDLIGVQVSLLTLEAAGIDATRQRLRTICTAVSLGSEKRTSKPRFTEPIALSNLHFLATAETVQ